MTLRPFILVLGSAVMTPAVSAQVPAGGEFQVNTYTANAQHAPRVDLAENGAFVVAWTSYGQFGGFSDVLARRYDADGSALTGEIRVTTSPFVIGLSGDVASDAAGNFVVVWYASLGAGAEWVRGRRFSTAGDPLGSEFALGDPYPSRSPRVARDASGAFVVVWDSLQPGASREIMAQRFDAAGSPLGGEFRVNGYTTSLQANPDIAMNARGDFVVTWQSAGQDGSGYGVFAQRFDPSGQALGSELRVNGYTTGDQAIPSVSLDGDRRIAVVWHGAEAGGSGRDVFARLYDASGLPATPPFRVNTYTTGDQYTASVAGADRGRFVVIWNSPGQDGSSTGLFGQRLEAAGSRLGSEFRVNTFTFLSQFAFRSAASDAAGNFVVAWQSFQDGGGYGVFGQRFGGLLPAALDVNTTGNGVFEPGEVVDVAPSWRNVNGAAQSFGGAAVSFTGPPPAVYEVQTPLASYGTAANGETRRCLDCYRVTIPATTRPLAHWDAVFEERITPDAQGQEKAWRVHVGGSFADVPTSNVFYPFVETLLHHSITGGCGPAEYCPGASTAREQMAVFVLVAREGVLYRPPACGTPIFADVPTSSPFCPFIEELARRGVVGGCGGGNYCPVGAVTREQMPVFVLRTLDPGVDPPACGTPMFADVPAGSPFCRWIEELARRGVVTGCGGGNYCPQDPVTREQVAVFVAAAFGLTLYGP